MSNPIIYSREEYQDIICKYNKALYAATPDNLRPLIADGVKKSCNLTQQELDDLPKENWTIDPTLPRTKWTITQITSVLEDPWFLWDMEENCDMHPILLSDIFENNPYPSSLESNPINVTPGFTEEQQSLIKNIGGMHHYLFARTYYIDLCYGTQQYINFYYNGSEIDFIEAHSEDFLDYVDNTGMIKGNILLDAWRDNNFRASINILSFIKPLIGVFCEDFWNWTNPNIFWWSESASWDVSWNDNLAISDSWYDGDGSTIDINQSKLITTINNNTFPGYRISINDLYYNLSNSESSILSALFGNNLSKGPSSIQDIPILYNNACFIDSGHEDPPVYPDPNSTSIIPQSLNVIKNISLTNNTLQSISDNIDVFKIINSSTFTLALLQSCSTSGQLIEPIIQMEPDIVPGLPELPCSDEIDIVTDIFIHDMNLRITKKRVKIISIVEPTNVTSVITTTASCDETTINPTNSDDWNATNCDSSVYSDPEWVFPKNIITVPYVTDVFFDENGSLIQKKSSIKIIKKNNNTDITKTFAITFDCVGDPPIIPPSDPPPLSGILFDKSSWSNAPEPWKTYLDSSADRWETYLKLDTNTVTTMRNLYGQWNGIRLDELSFMNKPKAFTAASCSVTRYLNLPNNKVNSLNFIITINSGRNDIAPNNWIDIMTHELGHALGIGTSWKNQDTNNSTISGQLYPNTLIAYNNIIDNSILNNSIVPIEQQGSIGSKNTHFEDNSRNINNTSYPGLFNEIMSSTIKNNSILSLISIKNAVDIGYIEKNTGASEGNPTLDN